MAANGLSAHEALAPIIEAVNTMQSNTDRAQKQKAADYLDQFQKTPEAWTTTVAILQAPDLSAQMKVFAATTLKGKIIHEVARLEDDGLTVKKGKITFDLHQLPTATRPELRDTILTLLASFAQGSKPIRTQLCVSLAILAIQMLDWEDVVQYVAQSLHSKPGGVQCVLEFLKILPEEVTDARKINLTEDELAGRTVELLQDSSTLVLDYLSGYANSSPKAREDPLLMECIQSWLKEVPILTMLNSPLFTVVVHALDSPQSFDAAVDCFCAMIRETRDIDDTLPAIEMLCTEVIKLKPRIRIAADNENSEEYNGIARMFAEAGETWVLAIARDPTTFRPLVEGVLETCARDEEREAISHTFNFWYELKQYLTIEKFMEARLQYVDVYSTLVDIMIGHLEYPTPEDGNEADLFDGDREQEERFREYRHQMGDVLKDCLEVIGVTDCLSKPYKLIEDWVQKYGAQVTATIVPHWQKLEAPLFSLRSMGQMVPADENIMMPRLIPLLVQIPDQEKIRFSTVMALGRYTEWTAKHPDTLQSQLNFILAAFENPSREVVRAAALSFRFFGQDCASLLKDFLEPLQHFYVGVLDRLVPQSQEEVTEGVAAVVAQQSPENVYAALKSFCDPIMASIMETAQSATDDKAKCMIADRLQLITIFIQWVKPQVSASQPNPAVTYCQEIFSTIAALAESFNDFMPILERVCRCWRYMILSYRTAMQPLVGDMATKLVAGFRATRQGCFLWTSDSILREFTEDADPPADASIVRSVFKFYEEQARTFLRALNDVPPDEVPDLIEDFFRLAIDALIYHAERAIVSPLMETVILAAFGSLAIAKLEPLTATLHFLRDFLAYGLEDSPTSSFDSTAKKNPPEVRRAVMTLLSKNGKAMTERILAGMMENFPPDCIPDASGVVLDMFRLLPQDTAHWVEGTIAMLPTGTISREEQERLIRNIDQRIQSGEIGRIRSSLQDFTNQYRRRNVNRREGIGTSLPRFRYTG